MINNEKKSIVWWPIFRTVALALVVGAGSGVIASVYTQKALNDYAESLRGVISIPTVKAPIPSPIPGTYEEALQRVRSKSLTSVAAILPKSIDGIAPSTWISNTQALGYGAIVSDDGWIALDSSVLIGVKNPLVDIDVWVLQTRYPVKQIVTDPSSSLVMLRVDAVNLVSMNFAVTDQIESGTVMFAVDGSKVVMNPVVETNAIIKTGVLPAETFLTDWQMSQLSTLSMPVFNAAGDLSGFLQAGSARVLPMNHVLSAIRNVVKTGKIQTPVLGVYTIDLAQTYAIDPIIRQYLQAGALVIAPNSTTRALLAKGPAAKAGLSLGDVILGVDGEMVTASMSLSEILHTYLAGDMARLIVYRGGETITLPVVLGDSAIVLY